MKLEDVLQGSSDSVVEVTLYLREIIKALDPRVEEGFYGGKVVKMASFSIGKSDNVIAVLSPAAHHLKLYLHHTDKVDTGDLKLQGKGKHAKHIKIESKEEVDEGLFKKVLGEITKVVIAKA